ncbi:MAG: hypothetical protein CM15mL2_0400 [Caudoviricetes sp.]|nr:MAG: hypothetical protein CM15mL2_0400 [Caudoviricetes sp.]
MLSKIPGVGFIKNLVKGVTGAQRSLCTKAGTAKKEASKNNLIK